MLNQATNLKPEKEDKNEDDTTSEMIIIMIFQYHHDHYNYNSPPIIFIFRPIRADFDVQWVWQAGQEKENHSEGEFQKRKEIKILKKESN